MTTDQLAAIRENPMRVLAEMLEAAGAIPVICGIPMDAPDARERIAALLARIEEVEIGRAHAAQF